MNICNKSNMRLSHAWESHPKKLHSRECEDYENVNFIVPNTPKS